MPGGVRRHLTGAQQRQIIGAIRKRFQGVHKHGEPLILDGLIEDVRKLSNTPAEMDWLGSGKQTKARIAQGFGTNPIIMGEVEGSNRASATAADKHFIDFTVNPKIILLSQCLTEYLSPMFGGGLKVWIEPCTANDSEMQHRWATLLVKSGAVAGNELRKLSPFDLEERGEFAAPGQQDRELADAARGLEEAVTELKRPNYVPTLPKSIAQRITATAAGGNGKR